MRKKLIEDVVILLMLAGTIGLLMAVCAGTQKEHATEVRR